MRRHLLQVALRAPVERAWRVAAATDQLDARSGLAPILYRDVPQEDGTTRRFFSTSANGLKLTGEEDPFSWEAPSRYEVHRRYDRGPFRSTRHECVVQPQGEGSLVTMTFDFEPRGLLGHIWFFGFGREILPAMERALRLAEVDDASGMEDGRPPGTPSEARPDVARKVDALLPDARALGDSRAFDPLRTLLVEADDYDLQRIRPLTCARRWGLPGAEVTDAFLSATHAGLLNLRWDVICPHCRGDKQNLASLDGVRPAGFCPACNVHFDVDLDRTLEPVFAPHPQVRRAEIVRYCLGGPGTTPHIRLQRLLAPGDRWSAHVRVEEGRFRLRVTGAEGYRWISAEADAPAPQGTISLSEVIGGPDLRIPAGQDVPLSFHNDTARRVLVVVEEVEWARDALPAGALVADERFRLLFSRQMLAPGVSLAVENVTILFTDLVGSTAMYGILGDARAFGLVWSHFDLLRGVVDERGGATVKTIGDAIMAAFPDAASALDVAALLHERIGVHLEAHGHAYPAALKIGMHSGPCIVVTLNDRLDYFGTTVNLAARVESQSRGADIVVSADAFRRAGGGAELLRNGWLAEPFQAQVRGFDAPVEMVRFVRGAPAPDQPTAGK
jgi:class 3 adenylate cyclase